MSRRIYEGSVSVAELAYTHPVLDDATGDYADLPIDGLDERVCTLPTLVFTLDYPFDKPYHGEISAVAGPTLRQIIDGIRAAYRIVYRGAHDHEIPNMMNRLVEGDYGRAYHVIGDLVIGTIDLDDAAARLDIDIWS